MNRLFLFYLFITSLIISCDSFLSSKKFNIPLNSMLELKMSENSNNNDIQSRVATAIALKAEERMKTISGLGFVSPAVVCVHDPSLNYSNNMNNDENKNIDLSYYNSEKMNKIAAFVSFICAISLSTFQHFNPISSVTLLHEMEKDSISLPNAVCNGKPTMIEFYADWCESCKVMAPTMRQMELNYNNKINFITLDGTNPRNAALVDKFRVDGIPHVAFIGADKELKTSLIGAAPPTVIEKDIKALINKQELPYAGLDAFEGDDHHLLNDVQSRFCSASTVTQ